MKATSKVVWKNGGWMYIIMHSKKILYKSLLFKSEDRCKYMAQDCLNDLNELNDGQFDELYQRQRDKKASKLGKYPEAGKG